MAKLVRVQEHPLRVLSDDDYAELIAPVLIRMAEFSNEIRAMAELIRPSLTQEPPVRRCSISGSFIIEDSLLDSYAVGVVNELHHAAALLGSYAREARKARVQLDPPSNDQLRELFDYRRDGAFGDGLEADYADAGEVYLGEPLELMTRREVLAEIGDDAAGDDAAGDE